MTIRLLLPALWLPLLLAQDTPPQPAAQPATPAGEAKPAPRETPADQKAYNDTLKITDPAKKLEALEKLKKDFPESNFVAVVVDNAILGTLAKMPDQTAKLRQTARQMYKAAEAQDKKAAAEKHTVPNANRRASAAQSIANTLLNNNVLLKDAEGWAKKSVGAMNLPVYLAEQRESYTKRKQNIPPEEELAKRFKEQRAARVATLGQIELKLGKTKAAKALLAEAYGVNNSNVAVASALGEIAAKEGDNAKAYDYLLNARLSGRIPDSANTTFETLYKQQHNGSLEGLDAALDSEYHKRFPNPVHAEPYKPTESRSTRAVLAEVFTGAGCPPCVAADLAFDATMERFSRKELVVVMYHQHIPAPDPITNLDTQARFKTYSGGGVPTFVIDGKKTSGGGPREFTRNRYDLIRPDIEKDLELPAAANVKVDAALSGNTVTVAANISGVKIESKDLKVQILLLEKEVRYSGENGVRFHPMVVRAMGGEKAEGYALERDGKGEFHASFDLDAVSKAIKDHLDDYEAKGHRGTSFKFKEKKFQINRGDLAVAVFVQDDKTKHVLQSAYVDLSSGAGTRSTNEAQ